ncbi:uncharacterized protein VP01_3886g1 [Puccinia sorghi]|uniref:Uncharacterized protein n=1 Tax=Puccinia sorghi TaxID=27349 RepID=A0A0L6USU0_9BASI|nr:uncharacterized protein VP01_3886g1 [Puccinia sorghi]
MPLKGCQEEIIHGRHTALKKQRGINTPCKLTNIKMDASKINHFLRNGTHHKALTEVEHQVLAGWRATTIASSNAAVKKFNQFKAQSSTGPFRLPLKENNIYNFLVWAGRGNSDESLTLATRAIYPQGTNQRVKLILKALGRQDTLLKFRRNHRGPIPLKTGITATDTKRFELYATIDLHNAKTKKPGKFQILDFLHKPTTLLNCSLGMIHPTAGGRCHFHLRNFERTTCIKEKKGTWENNSQDWVKELPGCILRQDWESAAQFHPASWESLRSNSEKLPKIVKKIYTSLYISPKTR